MLLAAAPRREQLSAPPPTTVGIAFACRQSLIGVCLRHAPDADDSLEPTTNTSAPQHFDCKDRNSALYPAAASYIACVVLLPLSLAVDPRYSGMKYFREKSWEQKCAIEEKKLLREWRDQQVLYASQPFRACERATDHALWCGM